MPKKPVFKFGYLYGNPKRRKMRSVWYSDEFARNLNAAADKSNGFRVRKFKKRVI